MVKWWTFLQSGAIYQVRIAESVNASCHQLATKVVTDQIEMNMECLTLSRSDRSQAWPT